MWARSDGTRSSKPSEVLSSGLEISLKKTRKAFSILICGKDHNSCIRFRWKKRSTVTEAWMSLIGIAILNKAQDLSAQSRHSTYLSSPCVVFIIHPLWCQSPTFFRHKKTENETSFFREKITACFLFLQTEISDACSGLCHANPNRGVNTAAEKKHRVFCVSFVKLDSSSSWKRQLLFQVELRVRFCWILIVSLRMTLLRGRLYLLSATDQRKIEHLWIYLLSAKFSWSFVGSVLVLARDWAKVQSLFSCFFLHFRNRLFRDWRLGLVLAAHQTWMLRHNLTILNSQLTAFFL